MGAILPVRTATPPVGWKGSFAVRITSRLAEQRAPERFSPTVRPLQQRQPVFRVHLSSFITAGTPPAS